MTLNPALEDVPLLPALRGRGRGHVTRARSACPSCGYAAFYNPKPVACAIPRDADGPRDPDAPRRPSPPRPLDDAGRVRRPRRVGPRGGAEREVERSWRSTRRSATLSASTQPDRPRGGRGLRGDHDRGPAAPPRRPSRSARSPRAEIPWEELAFWSDERALRDHLGSGRPGSAGDDERRARLWDPRCTRHGSPKTRSTMPASTTSPGGPWRDDAAVGHRDQVGRVAARVVEVVQHGDQRAPRLSWSSAHRSSTSIWCAMSRNVVGSSSRRIGVCWASTGASHTRWRWPPDSSSTGAVGEVLDAGGGHRGVHLARVVARPLAQQPWCG